MSCGASAPSPRVVGVLPDVTGVDRLFSYRVPRALDEYCVIGAVVRVPLGPRRVRGWVIEDQAPSEEHALRDVHSFVSFAATTEVVALARFASWRYAGRLRAFLVAASPTTNVRQLPATVVGSPSKRIPIEDVDLAAAIADALRMPEPVLRLPPATPRLAIVESALQQLPAGTSDGSTLVLLPEHADVTRLFELMRGRGHDVVTYPQDWQLARSGAKVVIGTRSAVLAPLAKLAGIVVLDAHAEAYINERAPTWRAPELAQARARRAGVSCLLVSPAPTLDLLKTQDAATLRPEIERAGWPHLEIIDRRAEDPRAGLFSPRLAEMVRAARLAEPRRPVVAMLNRTGRAKLLACRSCGELVTCERCGAALSEATAEGVARTQESSINLLVCPKCHTTRPVICSHCHSTSLRALRFGVQRATEEFAALVGEEATELTGLSAAPSAEVGLIVGTEAALHRVRAASLVVMLDFDQELGAHRLRGAEQALSQLARAGRLVGGRGAKRSGFARRVIVQTRIPDHVVLQAALFGDPEILTAKERAVRTELALPPYSAIATLSGEEAAVIGAELAVIKGISVAEGRDGGLLVRAPDAARLSDALRHVGVTARDVRVAVDPESL